MTDTTSKITLRQLKRYIDTNTHVLIRKYGGDKSDFSVFKIGGDMLAPYLDYAILGISVEPSGSPVLRVDLDIPGEEAQNG